MLRYLTGRLAQAVFVIAVMSLVIYALIGLMPGDPVDAMIAADPDLTPADLVRLKALYGLDRPLMERYLNWLGAALAGDFGHSRLFLKPVFDVMAPALATTAVLMGLAFSLSVMIAIPAGIIAASRPFSKLDMGINLAAFAGISIPPFWLALLLIMGFAVGLDLLPAGGTPPPGAGLLARAEHLLLPVLCLTLAGVGGHIRYVRAAMTDTLGLDYIRTARAKGQSEFGVTVGHALRNAMIPVATVLALDFGYLFSGALITETVFAYPGMGKLIFDAVMGNDFNLALAALLLATCLTLAGNLLADGAIAWLDPRISFARSET